MGEYAIYNGHQVKIGTCESMLYLRADQAALVDKAPNSLDLAKHGDRVLYRFPWPDEDGTAPGNYGDPFRSLPLAGTTVPDGVRHYRDHEPARAMLVMQRWLNGRLVAVCRCETCDVAYRLPDGDDVRPVIAALHEMAAATFKAGDDLGAVRLRTTVDRVTAGYVLELATATGGTWYGADGTHWYPSRELATRAGDLSPEPFCDHDAPAVVNGACECGALVVPDEAMAAV